VSEEMVRANVHQGSPGGRRDTMGSRICERGRFKVGSERERELWISRVVNQKRKK